MPSAYESFSLPHHTHIYMLYTQRIKSFWASVQLWLLCYEYNSYLCCCYMYLCIHIYVYIILCIYLLLLLYLHLLQLCSNGVFYMQIEFSSILIGFLIGYTQVCLYYMCVCVYAYMLQLFEKFECYVCAYKQIFYSCKRILIYMHTQHSNTLGNFFHNLRNIYLLTMPEMRHDSYMHL